MRPRLTCVILISVKLCNQILRTIEQHIRFPRRVVRALGIIFPFHEVLKQSLRASPATRIALRFVDPGVENCFDFIIGVVFF